MLLSLVKNRREDTNQVITLPTELTPLNRSVSTDTQSTQSRALESQESHVADRSLVERSVCFSVMLKCGWKTLKCLFYASSPMLLVLLAYLLMGEPGQSFGAFIEEMLRVNARKNAYAIEQLVAAANRTV